MIPKGGEREIIGIKRWKRETGRKRKELREGREKNYVILSYRRTTDNYIQHDIRKDLVLKQTKRPAN